MSHTHVPSRFVARELQLTEDMNGVRGRVQINRSKPSKGSSVLPPVVILFFMQIIGGIAYLSHIWDHGLSNAASFLGLFLIFGLWFGGGELPSWRSSSIHFEITEQAFYCSKFAEKWDNIASVTQGVKQGQWSITVTSVSGKSVTLPASQSAVNWMNSLIVKMRKPYTNGTAPAELTGLRSRASTLVIKADV